MKNKKFRIASYLLAVFNILLAAVSYPLLPEQIPMNWNTEGIASYSDKYQLFLMCGLALFLAVLFDVLPHIDPRKENYQKFGSYYDGFCIFMQIFMLAMTAIILTESFRPGTLSVPMIVLLTVGILFLFVGNIMPKIKSNFYMGVKTPWTLSSEEVWRKTHRLGGKCFCLAGLAMILCAFLPSKRIVGWVLPGMIILMCLIPTVMSYIWWKQEQA